MEIQLRDKQEIQRAHDVISSALRGEMELECTEHEREMLHAVCDALCWVLCHDHNQHFAENLKLIEDEAAKQGLTLTWKQ